MDTLQTGLSLVALVSSPHTGSSPEGPAFSVLPELASVISCCLNEGWLELSPSSLLSPHEGWHTHSGLHCISPQTSVIPCCLKGSISAPAWRTGLSWSGPGLPFSPSILCGLGSQSTHTGPHSSLLPYFSLFMQAPSSLSFLHLFPHFY